MLSKSDIEFLKRVNDLRKELGLELDENQFNEHSFLQTISETKRKPATS